MTKHFETESRTKIGNYEVDVFLPDYKLGIEYDGRYYHENRVIQDSNKAFGLNEKGIDLIRIKEGSKNDVLDSCIEFCFDSHYQNLDYAIKELLCIVSKKTGITILVYIPMLISCKNSGIWLDG